MDLIEQIKQHEDITGHCAFGPSKLARIVACPASLQAELSSPIRPPGKAALRGTALHEEIAGWLSFYLKTRNENDITPDPTFDPTDQAALFDCFEFAKEMIDRPGLLAVHIEQNVSLAPWGLDEVYGTTDLAVWFADSIDVVDWKFGGTYVEVQDNVQLLCYAAGSVGYPIPPEVKEIRISVAQPALNSFKTAAYTPDQFSALIGELREPIELAFYENPPFHPGEKQCMWCPAKLTCTARQTQAFSDVRIVFDECPSFDDAGDALAYQVTEPPANTTSSFQTAIVPAKPDITKLVGLLTKLKALEKIKADIEKYLIDQIRRGVTVPGFKLVTGRNKRVWADEETAKQWLITYAHFGIKQLYDRTMLTPAKVEKLNKSFKKDEDFKKLVKTVPGNPTLVTEDDPREALTGGSFTNVKG